ncbi:hook microtubule tethering protein [Lycorma delicatula]|uniref:hook microtubule tethering protein n=1 Tax=Lycorma delicatula TaxID=130591 RepID=UPI003F511655
MYLERQILFTSEMNKSENQLELCDILLKWLQTFELQAPHKTLNDITDGVAMAQALHQIAPEFFSASWLSKIKTDCGGNWRLKVSNLKKVMEGIVDYYQEYFNLPLSDFGKPDAVKIGDGGDTTELGRLLQLILWSAVNCNHKQDYITRIMSMDESEQQVIMKSIQELENIHGPGPVSFSASLGLETESQVQVLVGELQAATEARDQMAQRCLELDMQVSLLQEEKAGWVDEKRRLMERLQANADDPVTGTGQLRRQVETLKEEIFKLENSRDDYRLKLEMQEKDMADLRMKLDEVQQTAGEARHLKDEVDILRETADKVEKYEASIQQYKKKLEELGDLKREMKLLETKNMSYLEQTIELEKEVSKAQAWKTQIDIYKQQVAEFHKKLNEETKRADKLEFEHKKAQDQLRALKREKECLINERDVLKEANEELKCCCQQLQLKKTDSPPIDQNLPEEMISMSELKQKVLLLQHENNRLRLNQRGPEDDKVKVSVIQSLLDDSTQQVEQLRLENRRANQRIMELEEELKEISERQEEGIADMRAEISDLQNKFQREKERRISELEERDAVIAEKKQDITLLQETLSQKVLEVQESQDRHKKYLEKARTVAVSMDKSVPIVEVNLLKSQLIEKQKIIDDMTKENEKIKIIKELEENLMSSAFHNLGHAKQRESVDRRMANQNFSQFQSFLGRQRQASSRKTPSSYNSK